MKNKILLAYLFAALGVILFSSKAIFVKLAYTYNIDSVSLLLLRMAFSVPVYIIISVTSFRKQTDYKLTWSDTGKLFALGILGYYLASYLDFEGLNYISAGLERLILFVYPTMVVIIAHFFFKKKISKAQEIAIIITYLGVAVIFFKPQSLQGNTNIPLGSTLVFLSALSYAIYLNGSGEMIAKMGSVRFTSLVMIFSFMGVCVHYFSSHHVAIQSFQPEVYYFAIAMAIFATIIPSYLIAAAIKQIGASNFAIVGSLGPVSTIILAFLFLNESIVMQQVIGGIVIIIGVTIINLKKKA